MLTPWNLEERKKDLKNMFSGCRQQMITSTQVFVTYHFGVSRSGDRDGGGGCQKC